MRKNSFFNKSILNINKQNNRGITLIALVITIVVLLILAGVSIALLTGQNGILTQAQTTKAKTAESQEKEMSDLNNELNYIKQTIGISADEITKEDFGKVVTNYNADGKTWEIFYADNSNIYLISRESCENQSLKNKVEGYNGTSDFNGSENFKNKFPAVQSGWLYKTYAPLNDGMGTLNYSSDNENMKSVEYLLDSTIWNPQYLDNTKADWVIGAPTLELLVASYNKFSDKNIQINNPTGSGYELTLNEGLTKGTVYNHSSYYWIACPNNENGEYVSFFSTS